MRKLNLIILIFAISSVSVVAQMKKGRKQHQLFLYKDAIKSFEKVIKKNQEKNMQEATTKLADCYRMLRDNQNTFEWYQKAVQFAKVEPQTIYYYAESLRGVGKYIEAAKEFRKYAKMVENPGNALVLAEHCDQVEIWKEYEETYKVKNAGEVNSVHSEYSPSIFKDGLIFASDRSKVNAAMNDLSYPTAHRLKLLHSNRQGDTLRSTKLFLRKTLTEIYHDGPASSAKNDSLLFFTRVFYDGIMEPEINVETSFLKLYYTQLQKSGKWTKPKSYRYNEDSISMAHPALTKDGKTLYFVSNLPGGFGKSDIYVSHFKYGRWSYPENLGPEVNTPGREMFPYIDHNGDLYFSSDAHVGYGGLDIFKTYKDDDKWAKPINLRFPVNTSYDDFGICFADNSSNRGYISSNRPESKGGDDIYNVELNEIKKILPICGKVSGIEEYSNTKVFVLNKKTRKVGVKGVDKEGRFCIDMVRGEPYLVKIARPNYTSCTVNKELSVDKKVKDLTLTTDCNMTMIPKEEVSFNDTIFYSYDRSKLRVESQISLDSLKAFMSKYPESTLKIKSYTDVRGTDNYNKLLSQRRATSAKKHLVKAGLDIERIKTYGKGEFDVPEGTSLTEAYHQWCRRSELHILYKVQPQEKSTDLSKFKVGETYDESEFEEGFFE